MTEHEYAFDVKLAAVVRVKAKSKAAALRAVQWALECADLKVGFAPDEWHEGVTLTEASMAMDDANGPHLFNVDGEEIEA